MSISIDQSAGAMSRASGQDSLSHLLKELDEVASLPLERARMLPPSAYLSSDLAALEAKRIFEVGWSCIGRVEQIPNAGDYVAYEIAGQPVVAIRQKDGSLKAFSNVCLHRCTTLLQGAGHLKNSIVCPYHAWTYSYEGVLRATPHSDMQNSEACKSGKMRLRQFKVEVWNNWIFVSLDPLAQPLAPQLEGLLVHMPGVDLGRYENIVQRDELWDVNWKLLTENFIESYHLFMVHPKTIEPWCSTRTARFVEGGPAYTLHHCPTVPGKTMAMVEVGKASDSAAAVEDPNFGIDFCVFPSFMAAGDRTQVWWMALQPKGARQTAVRYGFCVTPETLDGADRQKAASDAGEWLDTANSEDKAIISRVMQGILGPVTDGGTLGGRQDRPVWEFNRYVNRMLNRAS
jgi:phenylpropionate dioxygenase-like ring-hydroxylating dioxygenase large terminal subunit